MKVDHYAAVNAYPNLKRFTAAAYFIRNGDPYYGTIVNTNQRTPDLLKAAEDTAFMAEQRSKERQRLQIAEAEVQRLRLALIEAKKHEEVERSRAVYASHGLWHLALI